MGAIKMNENNKTYNFRGLKASYMGTVCRIISLIGVKEFKACFDNENVRKAIHKNAADIQSLGLGIITDIAAVVVCNFPRAEKEIQNFLASLTGMRVSEICELPLPEYGEMITEAVMKEEFRDFFRRVSRLFK